MHCAMYIVQSSLFTVERPPGVHVARSNISKQLLGGDNALSSWYTVHSVHYTVNSEQCMADSEQFNVQCLKCSVHCEKC